jgi:urea transporter/murein DD-endopeptidase MepM/ murein hydrolase activator NlpD
MLKLKIQFYWEALINSYSQIFFSNHKWFGYLLLLASLVNPYVGIAGIIAGITAIIISDIIGFDKESIQSGLLSFNSIMVGFIIGLFYKLSLPTFGFLILASLLTTFISVGLKSFLSAYGLPILGLPFVLGVWTVLLGANDFKAIELSERGIYTVNEYYALWGEKLGLILYEISLFKFPLLIDVYLKSLGAIFLQYNLLVGGFIALGLLIYSRIAFTLSIIGFFTGYYFCLYFQGDMNELEYSYIGFNYILTSIALGGFFIIPSSRSYLLSMLSSALIALSISALGSFFVTFGLPIYSLPFTLVVILILFILFQRQNLRKLFIVQQQLFSPEKNLYAFHHNAERYKNDSFYHISLPFYGEWTVSQAHDGKITHKGDWQYAFDFVITDKNNKTYQQNGVNLEDFYCYNVPVLAPADGWIVDILDNIPDNEIGGVNIEKNWGNAIVIKHADFLYSKLTHLKEATFKFKIGEFVKKGDVLATCGNSGRSPEPHIHFQIQSTPYIGAKTLKYPLAYYVSNVNNKFTFHAFEYPKENQKISKVLTTPIIKDAFNFVPGMTLKWLVKDTNEIVIWEVFTNAYNQVYLYCQKSNSVAYLQNNATLHYFTSFEGDTSSLLHDFYLASYKVVLGYYEDMEIKDILPLTFFFSGYNRFVQDFLAPFKIYLGAYYVGKFKNLDSEIHPNKLTLFSETFTKNGNNVRNVASYELEINRNGLQKLIINKKGECTEASAIY